MRWPSSRLGQPASDGPTATSADMPPTHAPALPPLNAPEIAAAARALGASGGGAGTARLLALLLDRDVDVKAVLQCLRSEPALAARVLKVANEPFYGQPGQVGTLERAVQLLGLSAIRGVAAAGCLDRLAPPSKGTAFDPERFRQHSLAVASAAEQLSRLSGAGVEAEAFMAGLLHDIGLVLLARLRPQDMQRFAPAEGQALDLSLRQERAHFGATHLDCSVALINSWGLPDWLGHALTGEAAAAPADSGLSTLPLLLSLADDAARAAGFGLWPGYPSTTAGTETLGLTQQTLDQVAASLPDAVRRLVP